MYRHMIWNGTRNDEAKEVYSIKTITGVLFFSIVEFLLVKSEFRKIPLQIQKETWEDCYWICYWICVNKNPTGKVHL